MYGSNMRHGNHTRNWKPIARNTEQKYKHSNDSGEGRKVSSFWLLAHGASKIDSEMLPFWAQAQLWDEVLNVEPDTKGSSMSLTPQIWLPVRAPYCRGHNTKPSGGTEETAFIYFLLCSKTMCRDPQLHSARHEFLRFTKQEKTKQSPLISSDHSRELAFPD